MDKYIPKAHIQSVFNKKVLKYEETEERQRPAQYQRNEGGWFQDPSTEAAAVLCSWHYCTEWLRAIQ